IAVIRVNDLTEQEVITQIKNRLLDINAFPMRLFIRNGKTHPGSY
ncbi:MAG: hypothetical protein IPO53_09425, partial [Chitinophagaceae bacterium]|nr:hypothetical protein [Chitinophagaceae bacterium]